MLFARLLDILHRKADSVGLRYSLTQEIVEQQGVSFQQGLQLLKSVLPTTAVLIGQNIGQDVQWLQLKEGRDFQVRHDCYAWLFACMA